MPSVKAILDSSVLAIGFQICFYMRLAGLACAWHYRNKLSGSLKDAITHVVWPLLGGVFMIFIAVYSIPTFDKITLIIGIGGLLIGIIPLLLGRLRKNHYKLPKKFKVVKKALNEAFFTGDFSLND